MKRPIAGDAEAVAEQTAETDSVRRGLEILRCFTFRKNTLTLSEVVNQTGIPRLTAVKLLNTLVAHHFLRYLSDLDHYEPDVACLVVGHSLLASLPIVRTARPIMKALSEKLGVDVMLAFKEGSEMIIAEYCGHAGEPYDIGIGATMPLGASAVGRAWLWSQRASTQGKYMERIRSEAGEGGRGTMLAIYRAFQDLEELGYCLSLGDRVHEPHSVATPVSIRDSDNVFVLACVTTKAECTEGLLRDELAAGMLEAAARIGKETSAIP